MHKDMPGRIWICVDWRARAKNQEEKAFATSGLRGQAGNNLPASCFYYTVRKEVEKFINIEINTGFIWFWKNYYVYVMFTS